MIERKPPPGIRREMHTENSEYIVSQASAAERGDVVHFGARALGIVVFSPECFAAGEIKPGVREDDTTRRQKVS